MVCIIIHLLKKHYFVPTEGFKNVDVDESVNQNASYVTLPDPQNQVFPNAVNNKYTELITSNKSNENGENLGYTNMSYKPSSYAFTPTSSVNGEVSDDENNLYESDDENSEESNNNNFKMDTVRSAIDSDSIVEENLSDNNVTKSCATQNANTPILPYGYTYFPHTTWAVPQKRPPVCTANTQPTVVPVYTGGVPESALEIQSSRNHYLPPTTYRSTNNVLEEKKTSNIFYPGHTSVVSN